MKPLAVWLDRHAEEACPGLDQALAMSGALVLRCFDRTPSPSAVRRMAMDYRQVVVLGGANREQRAARVELATTTLTWPVIVLSPDEDRKTFGAGVVDVLKPASAEHVARRVVLMSEVPIVSNANSRHSFAEREEEHFLKTPAPVMPTSAGPPADQATVVAIVSSTGGSFIVADLLKALRRPSGKAVLLAQHLEAEFVPFFAEWLANTARWPVRIVTGTEPLCAETLYLATGGMDLRLQGKDVKVTRATSHWVPNGDTLLDSLAEEYGPRGVGIVLSGMGGDGATGLAAVARRGGRALVQAPSTAIVPSMPERALQKVTGATALSPADLLDALQRP